MRILKYLFLLFLLLSTAFVVFVTTQPGDYKIMRKKEINISKDVLYHFISDTTSLNDWSPWEKDEISLVNKNLSSTDSIAHTIILNEEKTSSLFHFQKTNKGTIVTWEVNGKLDLKLKILSVLKGGATNVVGSELEKGLANIDHYLVNEISNYTIKINGLVTKNNTNYIQQEATCAVADFQKKSKAMLQNMVAFVTKNDIKITGLPFVIYKTKKTSDNKTVFAMCVPVEEEILTTEGSEISGGHFDSFLAVKATLNGDYSHNEKAWKEARKYMNKSKLSEDLIGKPIEIYKVSLPKERKPSKWVTEIYIPVQRKISAPKPESTEVAPSSESNLNTNPVQ